MYTHDMKINKGTPRLSQMSKMLCFCHNFQTFTQSDVYMSVFSPLLILIPVFSSPGLLRWEISGAQETSRDKKQHLDK